MNPHRSKSVLTLVAMMLLALPAPAQENSWGESGDYQGIWYMSRDYMTLNTTYLFLNRNALPKKLRKAL